MAKKRKKKSSRLSKIEIYLKKKRSEAAKKGWVTRRQRYTPKQIRAQAKRGPGKKKRVALESRAQGKAIGSKAKGKKKAKQLLDRIAALEKQIANLKKKRAGKTPPKEQVGERIRDIAIELGLTEEAGDLLYDARRQYFTEHQYRVLMGAQTDSEFDRGARIVAEETGLQLREVYSNWLSP